MFVGRKEELRLLRKYIDQEPSVFLLYGKRRVGKTALIKEALKNRPFVYFQCYENSLAFNLEQFENTLILNGVIQDRIHANSFSQIFYYLNLLKKKFVIVIDEYSYLSTYTDNKIIDSDFQHICDNQLGNIHLILCGSQINIMSSLLNKENPLYGRIRNKLLLKELNYVEASYFYPNKSIHEKIAFYAVFGGSPFVLKEIDPSLSLKENIMNTYLSMDNDVFDYAYRVLFTGLSSSLNIKELCSFIKNGKNTLSEIEDGLNVLKNGTMFKRLKTLHELQLIEKTNPVNQLDNPKASTYELNDNAVRFFYTYVYPYISSLGIINKETIYDNYIAKSLITYISCRFEEQARKYFSLLSLLGYRKDIIQIGRYHYNDRIHKKNGEFDVAIKRIDGMYEIVEVKYFKEGHLLSKLMRQEEISQVRGISELEVSGIYFLCSSGYEDADDSCIDIHNLYDFDFQ